MKEFIESVFALTIKPSFTYDDVVARYSEDHRYWHGIKHLEGFLSDQIMSRFDRFTEEEKQIYVLSAVFHDIIYDPRSPTNEEDSVALFKSVVNDFVSSHVMDQVEKIILATKICPIDFVPESVVEYGTIGVMFLTFDQGIIYSQDLEQLLNWEEAIRKEFSVFSYKQYKAGRIAFLDKITKVNPFVSNLIPHIEMFKPSIGLYVGSFNPFHVGHLSVANQASKMFDKVVIGQGQHPSKPKSAFDITKSKGLKKFETFDYSCWTTELIKKLKEDNCTDKVVLVRGIRNGDDLTVEEHQLRWWKETDPDVVASFFLTEKEFSHVSSSSIRAVSLYDEQAANKFIVN